MSKLIRNFILRIILLTIILAVLSALFFIFISPDTYFDTLPFLLIVFPVISSVVHVQLLKASQKSLSKFNIAFMLSFLLKLVVYVALAATIISIETENKITFVITVLLYYMVYTIYDIKQALNDLNVLNKDLKDQSS